MENITESNQVTLVGQVVSNFCYSHKVCDETFYSTDIQVPRGSSRMDTLSVLVPERLVDVSAECIGRYVSISGQFRSHNRFQDGKHKLLLFVFAKKLEWLDQPVNIKENNRIYLEGYICRPPAYRRTPLGKEVADILLAVNRPFGKSDYIPCICWGRNAIYASHLPVGEHCAIQGIIQNRDYIKKLGDGDVEKRRAYEVSVKNLTLLLQSCE